VIDRLSEGEVAQCTVTDASEGLDEVLIGAGLEIDEKTELLARGLFAALTDTEAAGDIDGNRLCEVDVAARIDGRCCLLRVKVGRAFNGDGIYVLEQLATAVTLYPPC